MSTVKRRLQDAGLLGRVAKKKPYLRLAYKKKMLKMGKRTQTLDRVTLPRRPASRSRRFTVDVEVFCGYYLTKLPAEDLQGVCFSK